MQQTSKLLRVQVIYNAMTENNCSEQASRMSAMESSTKNASEMLEKLTLSYNRCVMPCRLGRGVLRLLRLTLRGVQDAASSHHNRAHRDYLWRSSLGRLIMRLSAWWWQPCAISCLVHS